MSKCIHNEEISEFCIQQNCQYPTASGCPACFIEDHPHSFSPQKITLQQLQTLMKKYLFSKKVKPQCLNIQQSFISIFKQLKTALNSIVNNIEQLCRNVVNSIGFPYLSEHGHFKIFKRIKNNDLAKISANELREFVKGSRDINQMALKMEEQRLYIDRISKYYAMVKDMDLRIVQIYKIFGDYGQNINIAYNEENLAKLRNTIQHIQKQTNTIIIDSSPHKTQSIHHHQHQQNLPDKHKTRTSKIRPQPIQTKKIKYTSHHHEPHFELKKITSSPQQKKSEHYDNKHEKTKKTDRERRKSFNQNDFNFLKIQKVQDSNVKNVPKRQRRERRNSIDIQLPKQSNLERKVAELKRNKQGGGGFNKEESQYTQSSKQIINYDLPQRQQSKQKIPEAVEIVPITRKINQTDNPPLQECQSPLYRKKMLHQSQKLRNSPKKQTSSVSSKCQNPYMVDTPLMTHPHTRHPKKNGQITLHKPKNLPELTQPEQLSYMLLIKSLNLNSQQAIPLLQKSLEASQNNLSSAQYLSFLYLEANLFEKCCNLCEKYLKILAKNMNQDVEDSVILLISNRSGALNSLGRYSETVELINRYQYENQIILKNAANAYYCLGKYALAIPLYQKALKDCNDDEMYYNLSACWFMREDFTAAKFILQSALNTQPNKPQYKELQHQINKHITEKNKLSKNKNTFTKK